jgi:transglutaminase-like putative cysteine protease
MAIFPPPRFSPWLRLRQRLGSLPRDTRDTLFLLAVIAWVIAPHAAHLPLWCSALAAGVLLWRALLAWQNKPLPGLAWRVLLLAAAMLGTWLSHQSLAGREGGVTLAVVLLCLKTLELRARRDAFVVFFFGFFIIITHFLFGQSLLLALAMLLGLWGLLAAVVNAHMPAGRPPLAVPIKTAGRLMLLGAPIMAALFMLFPRFTPLWGIPSDQAAGKTGLSDSMQVGQVAELALDERIAFRIQFDGAAPPKNALYFRGPVLSEFDGHKWLMDSSLPPRPPLGLLGNQLQGGVQGLGTIYRYEITQEPNYRPWLLALEAPIALQDLSERPVWQSADLQLLMRRPASDLLRYRASSQVQYRYDLHLGQWRQQQLASLPAGSNPRTVAWAQNWWQNAQAQQPQAGKSTLAQQFAQHLLATLHDENYRYTLAPGLYGQHSADEFWFDKKEGFCEHIASSFVIAMRAVGVPARIVTGYQGAEQNTVDGYWVVRNSDAHAWAEIWLQGQGWLRYDPTGAIAPWRVDLQQRRLAAPPTALGQAVGAVVGTNLLQKMRGVWDASNNTWNQWVLNYSQTRQLDILKKIGFDSPSWQSLVQALGVLLAIAALAAGLVGYWHQRQTDPWLRLWADARARLAKQGVGSAAHETPRQLVARVPHADWQNWLLQLEALRYRPHAGGDMAGQMAGQIKALRRALRQISTHQ